MIDLTPLDVRKKRGDFGKGLRGYDPEEVDSFLELVAERMEVLVKENLAFREKIERLGQKVIVQEGREQAIQDALVTAQELRQDVKKQASREAKLLEREARGRIEGMVGESEKLLAEQSGALQELERQRDRFLKAFRTFLERELDTVEVELGRAPLEDVPLDLDLGRARWSIDDDEEEDDVAGRQSQLDIHEAGASAPEAPPEAEEEAASEIVEMEGLTDPAPVTGSGTPEEGTPEEAGVAQEPGVTEPDDVPVIGLAVSEEEYGVVEAENVPVPGSAAPEEEYRAVGAETPPASSSVVPDEEYDVAEADEQRPPEGQDGGDSLWLSSIVIDREEEEAE